MTDPHLVPALRILARDIICEDGVATAVIAEAAEEIVRLSDKWISVADQVPEDGTRVLAHYDGRVFTAERFEGIWHWIEANTFTHHVEHWMLLPEPPPAKM
jgi:hypothetical protein